MKQNFTNPQNIEEKNLLIFENNLSFEITVFKEKQAAAEEAKKTPDKKKK